MLKIFHDRFGTKVLPRCSIPRIVSSVQHTTLPTEAPSFRNRGRRLWEVGQTEAAGSSDAIAWVTLAPPAATRTRGSRSERREGARLDQWTAAVLRIRMDVIWLSGAHRPRGGARCRESRGITERAPGGLPRVEPRQSHRRLRSAWTTELPADAIRCRRWKYGGWGQGSAPGLRKRGLDLELLWFGEMLW